MFGKFKARCRLCKKDLKLYKRNDMKMKSFFQPKRAKANPSKPVETDTGCDTSESFESLAI